MSSEARKYLKFGSVTVLILLSLGYLAYTGVQDSKSYYVTIKELNGMGKEAYAKRLRVAGNVVPGSIKRSGTRVDFTLKENDLTLPVSYAASFVASFGLMIAVLKACTHRKCLLPLVPR